jgi:hypothetical protein
MKPLVREQLKSLYVNPDLHHQIAVIAKLRGEPIREFVERVMSAEVARHDIPSLQTTDQQTELQPA